MSMKTLQKFLAFAKEQKIALAESLRKFKKL
ncbi:hypothetical protein BN906_02412 [Clostridium tetani 12124569]|nr:hypothetical protein BN906_02412 [Clostridium tetani 12124569]